MAFDSGKKHAVCAPATVFQEVLNFQHCWPGPTWTAQLFARSAWWAARQNMASSHLGLGRTNGPAANAGRILFVADQALATPSLELLSRMAAAMHLATENFAIWPNGQEASWKDMLASFRPRVVVVLGSVALEMLVGRRERLSQIHGTFMPLHYSGGSCTMMPIFHPDFLLINPAMKRPVWQDLQKVMRLLAE